jgi:hypothetical protein
MSSVTNLTSDIGTKKTVWPTGYGRYGLGRKFILRLLADNHILLIGGECFLLFFVMAHG